MERCEQCGKETPIDQLDAKPGPGNWNRDRLQRAADAGANFDRLECGDCYGPHYQGC